MMANRPGPFTLDSLPARRMTKRSQLFAILSEKRRAPQGCRKRRRPKQAGQEQQRTDGAEHDGNKQVMDSWWQAPVMKQAKLRLRVHRATPDQ